MQKKNIKMDLIEETLRSRPLVNSKGSKFPHELPPRLHVPQIKLQPLQSVKQMFNPWYDECNQLIQLAELHDKRSQQFEDWYSAQCLSSKPPGMAMTMLIPSRRE